MRRLTLDDGDRLCVFDAVPAGWRAGDPCAVIVHGLAGHAEAPDIVAIAGRVAALGVRTIRMNLRNAGRGFGLARRFYHPGSADEVRATTEWLARQTPGSPIALLGVSLGGGLVLKLAAEAADRPVAGLDALLVAGAPVDFGRASRGLSEPPRRFYDRNLLIPMLAEIRRLHRRFPELGPHGLEGVDTLRDLDRRYNAPRSGFADVDAYHEACSALPQLGRIPIPGLVVHAQDDPCIAHGSTRDAHWPEAIEVDTPAAGGHLGFISREPWAGDRRWLPTRFAAWLATHWGREWPY